MWNKIVLAALQNRGWVLGAVALWIGVGAVAVQQLPLDAVPDITNVQVVVNTKTGALDPERIEALVTRPIEIEMSGLPGLQETRSISRYGLSQVTLVFSEGTDIYWARNQVTERLTTVSRGLAVGVAPELAPMTTGLGEVVMYSVEAEPGSGVAAMGETERLTYLRSVHDVQIRPVLRRIVGVADVDTNGGFQKQVHINFFPERLERMGLTVEQMAQRLETLGDNFGGGYIERRNEQVIVRTVPTASTLKELEAIPMGLDVRGRPVRLKELAEVREDHALRVGAASRNGEETVLGTLLMRVGANSRQVARDAAVEIQSLVLPQGVKVVPLYSRAFLVNATVSTVAKNLAEGATLVIVVLLILLGNLRAAVLVALAIPLSMLWAVRGMNSLGVSGNLMSLGAIDFGLLVDGSVVLIENILSRLETYSGEKNPKTKRQVILEASTEVMRPVVFGLLLIMAVYVPILALEGTEGKLFRPMATTVLLALSGSLVVAIAVMPVLADLFVKWPKTALGASAAHHGILDHVVKPYRSVLKKVVDWGNPSLIAAGVAVGVAGFVLARMGADFVPRLDEGDLVINIMRDSTISLPESLRLQRQAEKTIARHPQVEAVFSRIGTPESATDPMGVNLADTFVLLKKDVNRPTGEAKSEFFGKLAEELKQLEPTADISDSQPIEMRFNEILEGSRADVTLRLYGNDLEKLADEIDRAKGILEKIPGAETVTFDALTALKRGPMLDIVPRFEALSRYGITLKDFNHQVQTAMGGQEVGSFFEGLRRLPVVLHLDESLRDREDAIRSLPLSLPQGGSVPLSQVATLATQNRVNLIAHSWGERYAAVAINLGDRDIASFVADAKAQVGKALQLPAGFRMDWGGQFKNLDRARARLLVIVPLTLVVVFLVLLRTLGSFRDTILVFTSVPFAGVGGVAALLIRGMPMSVSAAVGFIALVGIALMNALVLITVLQRAVGVDDVIQAAESRLRPVLMTALVASLGFLPMALSHGLGSEVQKPLATVVMGGLFTATALTLFLLPSWYFRFKRQSL